MNNTMTGPTGPRDLENVAWENQRFLGQIETRSKQMPGGDVVQVDMLTATLEPGAFLSIQADQPNNPLLPQYPQGGRTIASAEFGGLKAPGGSETERYVADRLDIIAVDKDSPAGVWEMASKLFEGARSQTGEGFLLCVANNTDRQDPHLTGYTFIDKEVGQGVIGRFSNLEWADSSGQMMSTGRIANELFSQSVSREQLTVMVSKSGKTISLSGLSETTPTVVKTRANDFHKKALERNQPQVDEVAQKATRGARQLLKGMIKKK